MKILLLNLLMNVAAGTGELSEIENYNLILDELNSETIVPCITTNLTEKVKVLDNAGNLIEEILKSDFMSNQIENSAYQTISKSSHMFD